MKITHYLILSAILFSNQIWAAREHHVKQGDSVISILTANKYPMETSQQQQHWLDGVMKLNKSKFIWGEINLIRPGSVLTLPSHPDDIKALPRPVPKPVITAEFDNLIRIAEINMAKGHVNIRSKLGGDRKIVKSAVVFEGDTLISSDNSLANITMVDAAKFELGANSKLSFEEYKYSAKTPENSLTLTRFYHGVMRATTGLIGKLAPKKFDVRTPVISIGIRGTDYVARHCEGDSCGEYTGSSLAVIDGGVATNTSSGSVNLNKGEFVQADISGGLSEVSDIPAGFLDLEKDVAQIEPPANWFERIIHEIKTLLSANL